MTSVISSTINIARIPNYFSHFPVRMHKEVSAIDAVTFDAIQACAAPGSKEHKQALYRNANPYGNAYALFYPNCDIKKLEYVVKIIEMSWIEDDITEGLPFVEASHEHEILRQGLHPEFDNDTSVGKTVGTKKAYLRAIREGMMTLDPIGTPGVIEALDTYFQEYDGLDVNFKTIEEYIPYRILNVGYRLTSHLARWAMNINLTKEESEAVREFEWIMGSALGLTNDYFSWNMDKCQVTDRVRNAVPVLMHQYSLPEKEAGLLLKGIIVDKEENANRLRMKPESQLNLSNDMKRYIEALELYSGGNCYWSATCPRYNRLQEDIEIPRQV